MGKKSPPPKPPDLTPITDAQLQIAKDSNELAREYLGMSRDQFAWFQENAKEELALARQQADRLFQHQDRAYASDEEARKFARQVGQTQIDAMNQQMGYAEKDRKRWEEKFLPMQDRLIEEAQQYDTPERREAEAARQMADVQRQAEAQRGNADARLRSMGIDPSQVRSSSLINQMGVATAANQAFAGNAGRQMIEDKGRALRADAVNIGMGLPAQAAMGYQGAGGAGQGAVNAAMAGQGATLGAIQGGAGLAGTAMGFRSNALNNVASLTGSPMQWAGMGGNMMNTAMSGYGQAANTMGQQYQMNQQHWKAGQEQSQQKFNNIMSVAGMAAGMMMSEGGEVRRPRRMSAGGLLGGALGKAVGSAARAAAGAVKDPADGAGATPEQVAKSWSEKHRDRQTKQGFIVPGKGSGEGGALAWSDRASNAMTGARSYVPTNAFSEMPDYQHQHQNQQFIPVQFSEGGVSRALPVRQSRDKIPALLTEGEYVLPADVVRAIGLEKIDKLVNKYHRENS